MKKKESVRMRKIRDFLEVIYLNIAILILDLKIRWEESSFKENNAGEKEGLIGNNAGMGVIEVVLITLVLVSLVLIFKNQLNSILTTVFEKLNKKIESF